MSGDDPLTLEEHQALTAMEQAAMSRMRSPQRGCGGLHPPMLCPNLDIYTEGLGADRVLRKDIYASAQAWLDAHTGATSQAHATPTSRAYTGADAWIA